MRIVTPEQLTTALPELSGNPRTVTQGNFDAPCALLELLDAAVPEYRLFIINGLGTLPDREGARIETAFVNSRLRRNPRANYYPAWLSTTPQSLHDPLPPNVVAVQTSRVVDGKASLGIEVQVLPGAVDAARQHGTILVAQVNGNLPFIHDDGVLSVDDIDLAVEIAEPVPMASEVRIDDESATIGKRLAAMMSNGATLRLGIDALPKAVMQAPQNSRGLRVWTELVADGFFGPLRSGALDETHPITATFAYGSEEFYAWAGGNPQLRLLHYEATNNPGNITEQPAVAGINTTLQADLFGAVNTTHVNNRTIPGAGGQADFIVGVLQSPDGQAVIALES